MNRPIPVEIQDELDRIGFRLDDLGAQVRKAEQAAMGMGLRVARVEARLGRSAACPDVRETEPGTWVIVGAP